MAPEYWLNSHRSLSLSLLCLFAASLQVTSGKSLLYVMMYNIFKRQVVFLNANLTMWRATLEEFAPMYFAPFNSQCI